MILLVASSIKDIEGFDMKGIDAIVITRYVPPESTWEIDIGPGDSGRWFDQLADAVERVRETTDFLDGEVAKR